MDNTWLQYAPTANKFKQTYVRGFMDISGNAIIRNGGLNIVNGNIKIGTNLDVNANGRIKGNLTVDRSIYAGTLDISNSAAGPGLTVRQFANQPVATFYKGNVMMVSINDSGDISANRNLNVGGNINLSGSSTVTGITKSMVGLANVDNTSDANKPVSTAQQTALDLKSAIASPTFTGTVTAPTVSITNSTTSTSTSSGALQVSGGVGIGGNVNIGGNTRIVGQLTVDGSLNITGTVTRTDIQSKVYISEQVDISNTGTGPGLVVRQFGLQPIAKFYDDANLILTIEDGGDVSMNRNLQVGGTAHVLNTTISTSTSSGALRVAGGVGIGGNLYVGGGLNVVGTVSLPTGCITSDNIADSAIATADIADSAVTGAKIATATISSGKFVAGAIATADIADSAVTGAKIATATISSGKFMAGAVATADIADSAVTGAKIATATINGNNLASGIVIATSGEIATTNTTISTSTTTGALKVTGGAGIGGAVYIGGATNTAALTASGLITANNGLTVSGATSVAGLTASGIITGNSDIICKRNFTCNGDILLWRSDRAGGTDVPKVLFYHDGLGGNTAAGAGVVFNYANGFPFGLRLNGGSSAGITIIPNNSTIGASTSTTTGALVVDGGVGVAGDVSVGGKIMIKRNDSNTGYGYNSLVSVTTAVNNTAFGFQALANNIGGHGNTAFGNNALASNKGANNIAVGSNALVTNDTGFWNIAVGTDALYKNTTGNYNVAIGVRTLYENTTGGANVAIGADTLVKNTTGTDNLALGVNSLANNTTGNENIAIGVRSLNTNATGNKNVAIGTDALLFNTTGNSNIALGDDALRANTGYNNIAIGERSLYWNTGFNNVAIGVDAGNLNPYAGNNNTMIGALAHANGNHAFSSALGYGAQITESNQIVLGTASEFVQIRGTHTSTSTTTGALRVAGGVGIGGNLHLASGNNVYVGGQALSGGNATTTVDFTNATLFSTDSFYAIELINATAISSSVYLPIEFIITGEALGSNSFNDVTLDGKIRPPGSTDHALYYNFSQTSSSSSESRFYNIYYGNVVNYNNIVVYARGGYKYFINTNGTIGYYPSTGNTSGVNTISGTPSITIESPHPSTDNYTQTNTLNFVGATSMSIVFNSLSSLQSSNYVRFYSDAGYTTLLASYNGTAGTLPGQGSNAPLVLNYGTVYVKFTTSILSYTYGFNLTATAVVNGGFPAGFKSDGTLATNMTGSTTILLTAISSLNLSDSINANKTFTSNNIAIVNTTVSSSASTGALVVAGGVGIGGNVYMGSTAVIAGDINIGGNIIIQNTSTNTKYGYSALGWNFGTYNTAFGHSALRSNSSGDRNTAFGYSALDANSGGLNAGNQNTAVGYFALNSNTSGWYNTAVGSIAGSNNTTVGFNTYIGYNANTSLNTTGMSTAIGYNASITESNQIVLGTAAEYVSIPGTKASTTASTGALVVAGGVGIGGDVNLSGKVNIISPYGQNYIGPGTGDNATATSYNLRIASWYGIGFYSSVYDYTKIYMDVRSGNVTAAAYVVSSDSRIKSNIASIDSQSSLDSLRKLKPSSYNLIENPDKLVYGFIAQEVKDVIPEAASTATNYVPSIYENAFIEGKKITLINKTTDKSWKKIKIASHECRVTAIIDEKTIYIETDISNSDIGPLDESGKTLTLNDDGIYRYKDTNQIYTGLVKTGAFVYGHEVDDFCSLNKDTIWTITASATQELDKQLQEAKRQIQLQDERIQSLEKLIREHLGI
jgi:hypothetical protein